MFPYCDGMALSPYHFPCRDRQRRHWACWCRVGTSVKPRCRRCCNDNLHDWYVGLRSGSKSFAINSGTGYDAAASDNKVSSWWMISTYFGAATGSNGQRLDTRQRLLQDSVLHRQCLPVLEYVIERRRLHERWAWAYSRTGADIAGLGQPRTCRCRWRSSASQSEGPLLSENLRPPEQGRHPPAFFVNASRCAAVHADDSQVLRFDC